MILLQCVKGGIEKLADYIKGLVDFSQVLYGRVVDLIDSVQMLMGFSLLPNISYLQAIRSNHFLLNRHFFSSNLYAYQSRVN